MDFESMTRTVVITGYLLILLADLWCVGYVGYKALNWLLNRLDRFWRRSGR